MTELSFQVSYFYNMLFDNMYSEDALTVEIPHIKIGHKFRFMDVVCYLFSLMYLYNGLEDNIMYSPTQILYIKGYNFNTDLNCILFIPNSNMHLGLYVDLLLLSLSFNALRGVLLYKKRRRRTTTSHTIPLLGIYLKKIKTLIQNTNKHPHVHCSIIYNK